MSVEGTYRSNTILCNSEYTHHGVLVIVQIPNRSNKLLFAFMQVLCHVPNVLFRLPPSCPVLVYFSSSSSIVFVSSFVTGFSVPFSVERRLENDGSTVGITDQHGSSRITDTDQNLLFEKHIRGGVAQWYSWYAKANNPYVPHYDMKKDHNYIMVLNCKKQFIEGAKL